jgi:hypothetical protein
MNTKRVAIVVTAISTFGLTCFPACAETWSITEGVNFEWVGQWTRQGTTRNFSAWQQSSSGSRITANVLLIQDGSWVAVRKTNVSTGNDCNYFGKKIGSQVSGTYFCKSGGPYPWRASISF